MGGGSFSRCGPRRSAARIRLKRLQQLQRMRTGGFQKMLVFKRYSNFKNGERHFVRECLSHERRALSS
eukprot:5864077-Pyramimonas_sp.AAC.1